MSKLQVVRWRRHSKPNPAELRLYLSSEGFNNIYHWVDRPGTVYGIHKHDTDQAHWVVSGELEIVLEKGDTYILKAGDHDYLPAETWHAARILGDEPASYFVGEKVIVVQSVPPKRKRGRPKKNL